MDRSENMRRIRSKHTTPELAVRRLVHSLGYRYRLYRADLPGKPDLVFGPKRKAIFVHGCFWHQHAGCKVSHVPKSNSGYWTSKLDRNVKRDALNQRRIAALGWASLTVWECELRDMETLRCRLTDFLKS
jgi:DNA mismatch endonuclease (patch repair protein)